MGLIRLTVGYPEVQVGNPEYNVNQILKLISTVQDSGIIVLPELAITGYTCKDLFNQVELLTAAEEELIRLARQSNHQGILFVGCPLRNGNSLYNCGVAICKNRIIGVVPKENIPNYKEFEEDRWFYGADGNESETIKIGPYAQYEVPFGVDLIFQDSAVPDLKIGCEICEDVWMPVAPNSIQTTYGEAVVCVNLSASNETVTKADYRQKLVEMTSGKNIGVYAYASCGPTESTDDVVFSGDCIVAENGSTLARTKGYIDEGELVTVDIDYEKLMTERRRTGSVGKNKNKRFTVSHRFIRCTVGNEAKDIKRYINPHPFVPSDPKTLDKVCKEIFDIQVAGLVKRMKRLGKKGKYQIGISGGLDSTLTALVAIKACEKLGWETSVITGTTMPGFGTSAKTKGNALKLMELTGMKSETVDICQTSLNMMRDIGHLPFGKIGMPADMSVEQFKKMLTNYVQPGEKDVDFENIQARARTFVLMSKGFVLGTGDLSELALGWCTYNGDHMSMYNTNCSIPKTLVKWLVKYVAENLVDEPTKEVLLSIVGTTISPELLPLGKDGEIAQSTEDLIGPYELHDFFLFNFVRNGYSPSKILRFTKKAFEGTYDSDTIKMWLKTFIERFFFAQFKRNCVPNGPKVGSVSLSPRGDWRMPSDAVATLWLKELK